MKNSMENMATDVRVYKLTYLILHDTWSVKNKKYFSKNQHLNTGTQSARKIEIIYVATGVTKRRLLYLEKI